jgi:hypothetical protein
VSAGVGAVERCRFVKDPAVGCAFARREAISAALISKREIIAYIHSLSIIECDIANHRAKGAFTGRSGSRHQNHTAPPNCQRPKPSSARRTRGQCMCRHQLPRCIHSRCSRLRENFFEQRRAKVQNLTLLEAPLAASRPMRFGFRSWEPDRPTHARWQVSFKVRTGRK